MIHAVYVRIGTRYFFFHYTFSQFYLGSALPSLILRLHKSLSSASPLLHPFSLKSSSTNLNSPPHPHLYDQFFYLYVTLFSLHVQTTADVSPVPFSKVQLPLFFP
uniref:Uncharacterized protein n=1 Tax=Cacopsylla melanoneura TaxID=428564 RepID=A0A8D9BPB3_9HEMI